MPLAERGGWMVEKVERYDVEASFYDVLYDYTEDILLYQEFARKVKGLMLECGCGTGRVTIPLARIGVNIVGIDTNLKSEFKSLQLTQAFPGFSENSVL